MNLPVDKKKLVSIRMHVRDVEKVRQISRRIGVRESDLFRFAVKMVLGYLAPLRNSEVSGRELVPFLVAFGGELSRYFELDAEQLARIVNQDVDDPGKRVDVRDIELLIMSSMQEEYAYLRLKDLTQGDADAQDVTGRIKRYMYEMYLGKEASPSVSHTEDEKHIVENLFSASKE